MKNKQISLNVRGNVKQLQAVKYWIDDTTIDIAYGGSKGCTARGTKVLTDFGYKEIQDFEIGDNVASFNSLGFLEYKKVIDVKNFPLFSASEYNKMIIFVMRDGNTISLTPNHEIYYEENWIPAGEFAKRILDCYSRDKWDVRNLIEGQGSIKQDLWTNEETYFETYNDRKGVFKNKSKFSEKDNVSSQISCYSFLNKSSEQRHCKSYRFRQDEQLSGEFGMGNCQRECSSFEREMSSIIWRQEGREGTYDNIEQSTSLRDKSKVQAEDSNERDVRKRVWGISCDNQRCSVAKEMDSHLISEIRFELLQDTVFDLTVEDNHNYIVTESNIIVHNSGKSFLGCSLICADALMYPGTHYFIARKTLTDLRKFTIPSVHEILDIWGIGKEYYKYNGQDNYFHFHNGSKIFLLDAKYQPSDPNYMRFGSMQMTRGWIEEAGEFELECKNNLQASIGRWKNKEYNLSPKLLQTCNPSKNYLYKDYYKLDLENTLPFYRKFIQALPSDNKTLPKEYIPNLINILSPNEIQRLVYGNWEFDDNPYALFDYQDILGLYTNEFIKPTEDRYITADIAYTGADKFVIMVWAGFVVVKIIAIDKIDDTMVSKKINELRIHYRVPLKNVIYDADGLQTFTRNSSQSGNLVGAIGFHNNAKPVVVQGKKENFKNLKAQVYEFFAQQVKDSKVFIQDNAFRKQVIEELEQINKNPILDDGKYALEPKNKVRERLGRSPDFADALAMRFYFELKGKPKVMIRW